MPDRTPITVVFGRFEDLVSRGLRVLIDEDPNIHLVVADVEWDQLPAVLDINKPHVAIVNFGSLGSAIDVNRLHVQFPSTRLVVLASRPSQAECNQMLAFGATACLSKETQARDILNAIHLASRGLHVLPRTKAELAPFDTGPDLLTPREADVLELLQQGRSNAEIAATLHVGIETVRTHARSVFRKLGVKTRRELASLTGSGSSGRTL
ncbi:MAG TPA: response regulator transcription factor [Solirubrobacteraceae bacterium]|jgi:DNA-binding NarL/FixJ family response regulator|nr:response regulator transcription factor [Solirubrobacteraceae bacterium]